ncbi:hypothetical protein H1R20_g15170, partial [Candolleomyces eurysporus]
MNSRATNAAKKPTTASRRTRPQAAPTDPDQLADALASRLKIDSRAPPSKKSPKEVRTESMKSINTVMQALTELGRTGWKKSATDNTSVWRSRNAEANALVSTSRENLAILRDMDDAGVVEIERAALSVVAKLAALDMHEAVREALKELRAPLCRALNLPPLKESRSKFGLISLPLPNQPIDDPVHLTMISTYLIHALSISCFVLSSGEDIDEFAELLSSADALWLNAWLPKLHPLPQKHIDSLLTRAYSVITKACMNRSSSKSKPPPRSIFLLRGYALRCLVRASPGTVEPDSFWDQLIRFTASLSKSCAESNQEEAGTTLILSTFESIVQCAEARTDASSFLDGSKFLSFCDYWITFAKRNGDICVLDRIGSLMQNIPSSSHRSPEPMDCTPDERPPPKQAMASEVVLEGTKLCGIFAQVVALVDNASKDDDLAQAIQTCNKLIQKSPYLSSLLLGSQVSSDLKNNEEFIRVSGKVDRAFERLRRSTHKLVDSQERTPELKKVSSDLLKSCVNSLQDLLPHTTDADFRTDIATRALDSLFLMGRTTLNIANPQTYIPAYDHLEASLNIIETILKDGDGGAIDIPNYLRCISGAFYNLAGSLYQASRHGAAVPFLKQTCIIGCRALDEYQRKGPKESPNSTKGKEREKEWLQLEQQLYRRWELLAVCYLKNGDRKNSYESFIKCIHSFPFTASGLAGETDAQCLSSIFGIDATAALKPLSSLLDRVTSVGACELLLPPDQVSLYHTLTPPTSKQDLRVVGALLEYQYESLFPHRCKDGARPVLLRLLQDIIQVYSTKDDISGFLMPIRRARTLVRCLEFVYRDDEDPVSVVAQLGLRSLDGLEAEVLALLNKRDLSLDVGLAAYRHQYAISSHLWLANLAHRRSVDDLLGVVSKHVDEANVLLDGLQPEVTSRAPKTHNRKSSSSGTPKIQRKVSSGGTPKKAGTRKGLSPRVAKVASPRATRNTRQRIPAAPKKPAPTRRPPPTTSKAKASTAPKTNARAGATSQAVTSNTVKTPPRRSIDSKTSPSALPFDDFAKFHDLLMLTTRVLGLLSLVLPRLQLLAYLRKLCQRQLGSSSEEFIVSSLELAYEYAKLGKLKRAASVFNTALDIVRNMETSPEVGAFFLLRFAETLALMNNVPRSSAVYIEAYEHSERILTEHKGMSSSQRIQSRARRLELSAMACHVFALIQLGRDDGTLALTSLLQSHRLWTRAIDTMSRLSRSSSKAAPDTSNQNPFDSSNTEDASSSATPADGNTQPQAKIRAPYRSSTELQWRLVEGLIGVLFTLADTYLTRGSPREAEYFLKQVQTLGESTQLPIVESRALTRMVEVQLGLGHLEDAVTLLEEAASKLGEWTALDNVALQRLLSRYNERAEDLEAATDLAIKALETLHELNGEFQRFDGHVLGMRRSLEPQDAAGEIIAPELLANVLSRYIWLLRGSGDRDFDALISKLGSLPPTARVKVERNSLMANLTLYNVHQRFQSDMFLNSLTESTIAIPMGMSSKTTIQRMLPINDVLNALDSAEKYFQESIALTGKSGDVLQLRNAAVSLTLVKAFQTSLGRLEDHNAVYASSLLDASSATTLRREMLDAIQQKLSSLHPADDFEWPLMSSEGIPRPRPSKSAPKRPSLQLSASEDDMDVDGGDQNEGSLKEYWKSVQSRYQTKLLDPESLCSSRTKNLPSNWTIVHVHLAEDKSTLLVSRQECGESAGNPLLFCVPLKGRRDNGTGDEEEHLSFEDAMAEFTEIIRLSNEGTKAAVHVNKDDEEARSNWWKQRSALDMRLKELLENIEFCWLGAFKGWVDDMRKLGWDGVAGKPVTEQQFSQALKERDLVVYFGHGGGEQYIRSNRIKGLPTCAATMLWGCSSGNLKDMGDFDRTGTPYNYMLGGCPTLIANLWDVTDRDIDKFSMSVFDKIGLNGSLVNRSTANKGSTSVSILAAVARSRDVCKLKYLTGAAPVVYGIPFHL